LESLRQPAAKLEPQATLAFNDERGSVLGKGWAGYLMWKRVWSPTTNKQESTPVLVIEVKTDASSESNNNHNLAQLIGYVKASHQQHLGLLLGKEKTTHGVLCDLNSWQFVRCKSSPPTSTESTAAAVDCEMKIEVFHPLFFMKNNFLGIEQLGVYLEKDIGRILSWLEQMFDVTYSTDTHLTRTKQFKQLGEIMLEKDPLLKALFKSAEKIATLEALHYQDAVKIATKDAKIAALEASSLKANNQKDAKIATLEATVASLEANNQKHDQDIPDDVFPTSESEAKRPKLTKDQ
jgi:hypothetical protein